VTLAGRAGLPAFLLACLGLVAATLLSIAVGARPVGVGTVIDQLVHPDRSPAGILVHDLRIPRTLLGLQAGAALGVAGALMQALTRNPLADPGLLGINAGAAFAVVLGMLLLGTTDPAVAVWLGLLGAGCALLGVQLLGATGPSAAVPVRLALAGAAVSAALTAVVTGIVLLRPGLFDQLREWELGSLTGRGAAAGVSITPFLAAGAVLCAAVARPLDAIALGDDTGRALGVRLGWTRAAAAAAVALLCGAATAAVGPIAFVGLTVPHMARAIAGPGQRAVLAWSAVLAPTLLLCADVLGRLLDPPGEVQVGVVVAFVGAPVFIALVRRKRVVRL
jgi:iron complex transport system permease protein